MRLTVSLAGKRRSDQRECWVAEQAISQVEPSELFFEGWLTQRCRPCEVRLSA